jgi:CRP-like cAMP-binding protein
MDAAPFFQYLRQYIDLTKEEEALIVPKLKYRRYLKGQYIGQEGNVYRYNTYILKGKVRTFYLDDKGNEHIVSFGIENWWVGDLGSFVTQTPADFNVQCLENTQVLHMAHDDWQRLFDEVPKMERFFRLLTQNAYAKAQKRIVRNHSMSAKDRYLLFLEEHPQIAQRVPQYMIASYLGITKEFLSHIRRQIAKDARDSK